MRLKFDNEDYVVPAGTFVPCTPKKHILGRNLYEKTDVLRTKSRRKSDGNKKAKDKFLNFSFAFVIDIFS